MLNFKKIQKLSIIGSLKNDTTFIETKNKDLILQLTEDSVFLYAEDYALHYSSTDSKKIENIKYKKIDIKVKREMEEQSQLRGGATEGFTPTNLK